MKKSLLAVTLLSVFAAGAANAAVVEAPKGTAGAGELTITGTLTNIAPVWEWEVANVDKFADMDTQRSEGIVVGDVTTFEYPSIVDVRILTGRSKAPAVASADLSYLVTIGGVKIHGRNQTVKLPIDGSDGIVNITVNSQASIVYKRDNWIISGTGDAINAETSNYALVHDIENISLGENNMTYTNVNANLGLLGNFPFKLGYSIVDVENVKLEFPGVVPATWTATLPIVVIKP